MANETVKTIETKEEVVVRAARGITVVSAEELGAKLSGSVADVPQDVHQGFQDSLQDYKDLLLERTEVNLQRAHKLLRKREIPPEMHLAGEPVTGFPFALYEYWDIMALSPIQFIMPPITFRPHKIIAGGELTWLMAVLFINPLPSPPTPPFGGPSATQYLGGRGYRIRFELFGKSDGVAGPDFTFVGTFPPIAPVISVWPVPYVPAPPGVNPRLVELNVTVDVTDPAQPFAAFATQWLDIEGDPGFPVPRPPGLRFQSPLHFLVYPK
jgi:hypothetical protein